MARRWLSSISHTRDRKAQSTLPVKMVSVRLAQAAPLVCAWPRSPTNPFYVDRLSGIPPSTTASAPAPQKSSTWSPSSSIESNASCAIGSCTAIAASCRRGKTARTRHEARLPAFDRPAPVPAASTLQATRGRASTSQSTLRPSPLTAHHVPAPVSRPVSTLGDTRARSAPFPGSLYPEFIICGRLF